MQNQRKKILPSFLGQKSLRQFLLVGMLASVSYLGLTRFGFLPSFSVLPSILCLSDCPPEGTIHKTRPDDLSLSQQPLGQQKVDQLLQQFLQQAGDRQKVSILVEKSKYKLTVFYDRQPLKSYPIVLGGSPQGDKFAEGDLKTPEGLYQIQALYPHPAWSKFLWLNYPTTQSWREHFQAKLSGDLNWFLPIGSEVGIHGVPNDGDRLIEQRSNWTWGCVSLKNADINELYQLVQAGTWVEIVP
jgi:murein L,D-transpeptidase YafK